MPLQLEHLHGGFRSLDTDVLVASIGETLVDLGPSVTENVVPVLLSQCGCGETTENGCYTLNSAYFEIVIGACQLGLYKLQDF